MKNTIAIIGAGSGISQAVAHRFGQEGYDVVLVARNAAHLRKLVAKLQAAGITATSAVADSGQPDRLKKALAGVDGLRVVHYNAAILRNTEVLAETVERLTQDFAVSMAGLLTAVKAALPQLEAHQGSVLLTSGGLARHPHPAYASLALGKAAQSNLATSLSQVLQPKGVYVGVLQITAQVSDTDAVHNPTAIAQHLWAMHTDRTALEVEL